MWLINARTYELEHHPSPNRDARTLEHYTHRSHRDPAIKYVKYSILSHRWTDNEPTFKDLYGQNNRHPQDTTKNEQRYDKMYAACRISLQEGISYVWIDTCCINKDSDAELSESINSMYSWYECAKVCLVYLHDHEEDINDTLKQGYQSRSNWFTRGWTLQELVAPGRALFYDRNWKYVGDKRSLAHQISTASNVPEKLLASTGTPAISDYSVAQRMSWAVDRTTTRPEDVAYSLLGLFQVNMPLLYGEGAMRAFRRLQEEIIRSNFDHSIFAWPRANEHLNDGMLALTPDAFRHSEFIVCRPTEQEKTPYSLTNLGLSITLPMTNIGQPNVFLARLNCQDTRHDDAMWIGIYLVESASKMFHRVSVDFQDLVSFYAELANCKDIAIKVHLAGFESLSSILSTGAFCNCDENLAFEISENLLRESESNKHVKIDFDEKAAWDHRARYVCRRHVSSRLERLCSIPIHRQTLNISILHLYFDEHSRPFAIVDDENKATQKHEPSRLYRLSRDSYKDEGVVRRHRTQPHSWMASGNKYGSSINVRLLGSGVLGPEHDARLRIRRYGGNFWDVDLIESQTYTRSLNDKVNTV